MDEALIFSVISSLFILIGALPYIRDIHLRRVRPHVLSWIGWGFLTGLGGIAMYAEGSEWIVMILFANALACFMISIYAVVRGVGVWQTGLHDWILFGMGIIGIILWQIFDAPVLALLCAIGADLSFGLPTVIKTYKDPTSETPFVWIMATLSGLLSLFAIEVFQFYEVAYPLYLLVFDATVLVIIFTYALKKVSL